MKNNYYFLTLPILYLFSTNLFATVELTDNLLLSAFASTSITKSDNETPLYLNREITDKNCFDCDTTLGIQLDYQFLDNFTSSIQIVKPPQNEWSEPEIEWLYLGYNYNQYDIKIGRLRLPTFLDSEYYYVAHAYTVARPPQEIYDSQFGITYYDGINITWNSELTDDISLAISPYATFLGEGEINKGNEDYKFTVNKLYGLKAELSSYNYRLFVTGMFVNFDLKLQFSGIAPNIPAFTTNLQDQQMTSYSFGGEYLWDYLTLRAEGYHSENSLNWYGQTSYSIDKLTPYLSYAQKKSTGEIKYKNHTITTGLRFDFTATISMNLEYQRTITDYYDSASFLGSGQFTEPFYNSNDIDANIYTLMINLII